MKLLEIKNLEIQFPSRKSTLTAVNNVSLSVDRGDILGIVGESGAGKSTVGNALIGLLEPPGIETKKAKERKKGKSNFSTENLAKSVVLDIENEIGTPNH